jgi:hypothetical protein
MLLEFINGVEERRLLLKLRIHDLNGGLKAHTSSSSAGGLGAREGATEP